MIERKVMCDGCKRPIAAGSSVVALEVGIATVEKDHRRGESVGRDTARGSLEICGDCMNEPRSLADLIRDAIEAVPPPRKVRRAAAEEGGEW